MRILESKKRATNWDLLRSLAMFLVVVVHSSGYIGHINGIDAAPAVRSFALICDPVFFVLSGYFAFRPLHRSLKDYYLNKFITILFPLILYSVMLYFYACLSGTVSISLGSYFEYFNNLLENGWWFIPTLVPCLIVAPFLFKGFEALSDKAILFLSKLLFVLYSCGFICTTFRFLFDKLGIETAVSFFNLSLSFVPPSVLSSSLAYFQFFLLGGVFRKVLPLLTRKCQNSLIAIGLILWVFDIVNTQVFIIRTDPNYCWIFASFAVMILFSRLDIRNDRAKAAITWTAQRSYSIYLLQYSFINVIFGAVYTNAIFGDVSQMFIAYRIVIWLLTVFASYLVSLGVASIIDQLILSKLQNLLRKIKLN